MVAIVTDEDSTGWDLEFRLSDWWHELVDNEGDQMGEITDPRQRELQNTFDNVGWGLLFLLFGVLALPNGTTEYVSAAAVGAAMLGLNALRIVFAVPVRWFSIILGTAFLVGGSGALAGLHMDVFVVFFVVAGLVTIAGALVQPARAVAR
jgi:hypothetical protein